MTTLRDVLDDILANEGSTYTDRPEDRGGPTKYGITQATLSAYRGRPCTALEVENLSEAEARAIYTQRYVRGPGFTKIIDDKLMALAVDCAVLHGQKRAVRWLQEIVGTTADGVLGPKTAEAINRGDAHRLYLKLIATRVRFLGRLITDDKRQAVFAAGWANRVARFLEVL